MAQWFVSAGFIWIHLSHQSTFITVLGQKKNLSVLTRGKRAGRACQAGDGGRRAVRSGLSDTRRQRAVRSYPPAEPPGSLGSLPPLDTRADGHLPVAGPGAGALIASPDFLPRG